MKPLPAAAFVALFAAMPPATSAEDGVRHDEARRLVKRGEIRPLQEILSKLATARPGEVVAVELDREQGRWVYEFGVVTDDGRRVQVEVDAATGTVLSGPE